MHCSTSTNVLGRPCSLFAGHTSENLYEGGWSVKIAFGELEALKGCRANSNFLINKPRVILRLSVHSHARHRQRTKDGLVLK